MRKLIVFLTAFMLMFAGCPDANITKTPDIKEKNQQQSISTVEAFSGFILYARDAGIDSVYSVDPGGQKKNQIYSGDYQMVNAYTDKILFYSEIDNAEGIYLKDTTSGAIKLIAKDFMLYSKPVFSSEGSTFAFIGRSIDDKRSWVYLMRFNDEKPVKVYGIKGDIKYLSFLDTETLLYSKKVKDGDYEHYQMFKYSLKNNREDNILKSDANDKSPIVSPDGKKIAYLSDVNNKYNLYVLNLSDNSVDKIDMKSAIVGETLNWSHDSRYILYTVLDGTAKYKIKIADVNEKSSDEIGDGYISAFSPDGRYLVYASYDIMNKKQIIYRRKLGDDVSEKVIDFPEDSKYSRSINMLYWTNVNKW